MKKDFFDYFIERMNDNNNIYFISAGLGWPRTQDMERFDDHYIQVEAAEQTALDIAVGLAYAGKIPFIYTITPFYLRAFETIRTYIDHEKLHVCMIGAGRDHDYSRHDGFSHEAEDIPHILGMLPNLVEYMPHSKEAMRMMVDIMIARNEPSFISIPK